jgi:fucose 4-O-acetylase-like acetyltransferase
MKQRNETYDLMKGIAMILMMLCHLVYTEGSVKQFIYSFHMPLFFILAGVFAKNIEEISSFKDYTSKNAKRLLLPYVVTMLMLCAWGGIQAVAKQDVSFFLRHLLSMVSASSDGWQTKWGLIYAGPMWFLIALFWVRELFYGIQRVCMRVDKHRDELVVGIAVVLSIVAVLIHPYLPSLPFSIMQACTALAFYVVGWYIHNHPKPWWVYILSVLVWPFAILYGHVALDCCCIDYYLLSFIGACGGTYMVYLLCKAYSYLRSKVHLTLSIIGWIGINSLAILCMHELEMYSDIMNSIQCRLPYVSVFMGYGEIVIAIIMAYILLKMPYLKEIYK